MGSPAGMRLGLIAQGCGDEKQFPWFFHPLRFSVGGSKAAGAIIGNTIIVVVVTLVCLGLGFVFNNMFADKMRKTFNTYDAYGLLRFPSAPLFVFIVLFQGFSLAGMVLTAHPPTLPLFFLGVTTTVACLALPFYVLLLVQRNVPKEAIYEPMPSREGETLTTFLFGPGEWVSKREDYHFALRFTCVLRMFTQSEVCFTSLPKGCPC